jgi:2',3'-cyclic-nucleotide 2'-phosphodiesterase (5'-nucleotidase family)
MNRGGIRAAIPRGAVTPRIVYQAIPFEEDLYMLEVTGAELREILEVGMQGRRRDMEIGGLTADRNQASPEGEKMENVMVGGEPLHPDSVYRFVTTGYLSQGNVGYEIMLEHEARYLGVTLMKAVTEYIAAHSPLTPDRQVRIRWIDEPR